jgi:IS30 family transposase
MRRSRHDTQKSDDRRRIPDAVSISERPATAEDRAVPGHWEGDLLCGNRSSQIATRVERQTRDWMRAKVASNDAETFANGLIKNARQLPQELYQSLTWDRGTEMTRHTGALLWRRTYRPISVTLGVLGSTGPMRIRMDYCVSISPTEPMFRPTRKPSSMR